MPPLVDIHVHLLAGLDDGPRTEEDALAMCRMAYSQGTRMAAAAAHQNDRYPLTPDCIRAAAVRLAEALRTADVPLVTVPCAEVMVSPDLVSTWGEGNLLSIGDQGRYVLIEAPHSGIADMLPIVEGLQDQGVRPILAHPERQEELLHDPGRIERLIDAGCLVQVSAASVTRPKNAQDEQALKEWVQRGVVHLLGSDGHSPQKRPPLLADAYQVMCRWAGNAAADRIGSSNGMAVLKGVPLQIPAPGPRRRRWLAWL